MEDLPSPAFCVDMDRLERNIETMRARAAAAGVGLRPHAKTHKTAEIVAMQFEGVPLAERKICVSTVAVRVRVHDLSARRHHGPPQGAVSLRIAAVTQIARCGAARPVRLPACASA